VNEFTDNGVREVLIFSNIKKNIKCFWICRILNSNGTLITAQTHSWKMVS
jgi:hypothetical protein